MQVPECFFRLASHLLGDGGVFLVVTDRLEPQRRAQALRHRVLLGEDARERLGIGLAGGGGRIVGRRYEERARHNHDKERCKRELEVPEVPADGCDAGALCGLRDRGRCHGDEGKQ